ncbi:MAG TPA: hypothetical protein VGO56_09400 [Pyrinomonadaceae bacterium]|jgi:hypothetical protein|nr:hypothetical protein [Pyrinomonadaceae bacterium]
METNRQTRTHKTVDHPGTTRGPGHERSWLKGAKRARRKFLRFFPQGFRDQTYLDWERGYKWKAHQQWSHDLDRSQFHSLLRGRDFQQIAGHAVRIESRTNLLFSFEKMALRDALKSKGGAQMFSEGLYDFLYGTASAPVRFSRWCDVVSELPRKQTRVLTWPIVTVFGFIAEPKTNIFLKPNVTRAAAREYGFDFHYESRPSWEIYDGLLEFAKTVGRDLKDFRPRDLIDIQSFIWVQGSDEYEE